jgi:hypothetical protein
MPWFSTRIRFLAVNVQLIKGGCKFVTAPLQMQLLCATRNVCDLTRSVQTYVCFDPQFDHCDGSNIEDDIFYALFFSSGS